MTNQRRCGILTMMAGDMQLSLRGLVAEDMATATAVVKASGLGMELDDVQRQASLSGAILVGAWQEGRLVGVAGAIAYGKIGVVGPMSVLPDTQGRGIGTRLLRHVVDDLRRRHVEVITLDATAAGAPLYRRHGFVTDFFTLHLARRDAESGSNTPARADKRPAETGADGNGRALVAPAGPGDLAKIDRFDAPIFGASRHAVLASYLSDDAAHGFVQRRAGAVTGYVFARPGRLGPFAAADPLAAQDLLDHLLGRSETGAAVVSAPSVNTDAVLLLERAGFVEARRLERMRLGGHAHPGDPTRLFALASYSLG